MKEEFDVLNNRFLGEKVPEIVGFGKDEASISKKFHEGFPIYTPTPLVKLHNTAKILGFNKAYVKDESKRFGLNAFKVLGGSFAIASYLAKKLKIDISDINFDYLKSEAVKKKLGDITFVTATDGNHGRGIAWATHELGMKSVVYMPKGSAYERLDNIRKAGAEASITDMNYDATVNYALQMAKKNNWVMVQDTSWVGYEEIPQWIMQGYLTMGLEAYEQLDDKPTHIMLQAGVGSLAASIAALFTNLYGKDKPKIVIVEPNNANCIYSSAKQEDGSPYTVKGNLDTIMAGLACGKPCTIAWDILKQCADYFITCPDYVSAKGMRILGNPAFGDNQVVSGESGASTFGCIAEIMSNPDLVSFKEQLQLNKDSNVLFFSTEGATDIENYRKITWDGAYSSL